MLTIVGILTFISMINTTERLKAGNFFISRYFSFYEQLKFRAQLSMKKMYNLGARGYKTFNVQLTWWTLYVIASRWEIEYKCKSIQ